LLLFPVTEKYEEYCKSLDLLQDASSDNVFFIKQTIPNACGTIALLHALANNSQVLGLSSESFVSKFVSSHKTSTPIERAAFLEKNNHLEEIHKIFAVQGQSAAPSNEEEVDLHFICFTQVDQVLYELDGRKKGIIKHPSVTGELLQDAALAVQGFIDREQGNLNFTLLALCPIE
jgi:ubiquitin carboxyl-terminal hydrolase L3